MFRNTAKKMISRLLATVLSAALVFGMATYSLEAQAATDRTCEGQWVFEKVIGYSGYKADTPVFDTDLNQAMLFNRLDDVTFVAMCGFPGEVIAGGEMGVFPMSMSVQDVSFKEGFRLDDCWLAATTFDIDNPHELSLFPDGNHIKFVNRDNPKDDRCICHGSVWRDPVDEDNYGSNLETKTATWRFPYGIRDGETLTVWFVDTGRDSKGPALGWRYVWHSTSGLKPMNVGTVSRQAEYNGSEPAWVMKGYELIYPDNKRDMKDIAVYQDDKNEKFTMAYLNSSDMKQSWGFFESVFEFPPEIIPDKTKFTVNITTTSLGGYSNMGCNGTSLRTGKNLDSWDGPAVRVEMWDEKEARYYSSVNTSGTMSEAYDSVTKPFTVDLFRSGPSKAGDELTIIYDAGPVIVFKYVWVE